MTRGGGGGGGGGGGNKPVACTDIKSSKVFTMEPVFVSGFPAFVLASLIG